MFRFGRCVTRVSINVVANTSFSNEFKGLIRCNRIDARIERVKRRWKCSVRYKADLLWLLYNDSRFIGSTDTMNIRIAIVENRSPVCWFYATKTIVSFKKDMHLNVYCDYACSQNLWQNVSQLILFWWTNRHF